MKKHLLVSGMLILAVLSNVRAQTWEVLPSPTTQHLNTVCFTDSENGWIAGDSGLIMHTTNRGVDWVRQDAGVPDAVEQVIFIDSEWGWIRTASDSLLRTTDGGATWLPQSIGIAAAINNVYFLTRQNGWIIGQSGIILHTTNSGESWVPQVSGTLFHLFSANFTDTLNGWIGGGNLIWPDCGIVLHTTDGGQNWTIVQGGDPNTNWMLEVLSITFRNATEGWMAVGQFFIDPPSVSGSISRTTNGGTSWAWGGLSFAWSSHTRVYLFSASPGGHVWAVDSQQRIWHRNREGNDWAADSLLTNARVRNMAFPDSAQGWAVGENGVILHYYEPPSATETSPSILPDRFKLTAYPNPFNPATMITYALPNSGHVSLRIYDLLGQEVAVLKDGIAEAGNQRVIFDGSNLGSGIYFARLDASTFSQTKKLVLMR